MPPTVALTGTRTRLRLLLAGSLVLAALVLVVPTSATAAPDITPPTTASVTAQLDKLASQTEALTEQFNAAQLEVDRQQAAVTSAQRKAAAAAATFAAARVQFAQLSVARYESGTVSQTGAILTSRSGQSYLDALATQDMLAMHTADVVARLNGAKAHADAANQAARRLLSAARATRDALTKRRDRVIADTAKFQALLATLTAAQQQAYNSRNAPSQAQIVAAYQVHAGTAAAQRAVNFAIAQVGKPYVWGAAGPDSYDCSGLTMAAWAHGGVSLPHSSEAQYNYGTHVGFSALQPGDLVFLYSDIHHVEIYVGNGLAVSAPQPGENVKFVRVADDMADYYGATRLA